VTDGTNPVQDATVNFGSDNGGIFSTQAGITDANGDFETIFNAPTVTSQIICRISGGASKIGYINGSGHVDVTINPIPWPTFSHNSRRTGHSPYDTSSNPGKLKWSFDTGTMVRSSPLIGSDETIYIGSTDGNLYAVNNDGTLNWRFTTTSGSGIQLSSPAIDSYGTVYVGASNNLYAVNPDGTEKWNFTIGGGIKHSIAIGSDGTIYVGSAGSDYKLYAINPDGTEKWNFMAGGGVCSPAIDFDGTIYVGSSDNNLYAINPDGSEKWRFTTGDNVHSAPAIDSNRIIYVGSHDNRLYAINPNGSEKWSFLTGGNIGGGTSPAIGSDGTIYVGSDDYNLYAIYPDGTEKWSFTTGCLVQTAPAIGSDETIFVGADDYNLYAINPDGTKKWSFTMGLPWVHSSPAIGSDGTIYIGSWDGNLYAINEGCIPPIAIAGPNQSINEGASILFNASSSHDPDGTIVSYHWDFGDGTEYTSKGQPSSLNQVTTDSNVDVDPRWNPLGDRIVFESTRSDYKRDLWTIDRDGKNPQKLIGDYGWYERFPAWSPDGTKILYSRGFNDGSYQDYDIWVVNADGTNPHAIRSTSTDERLGDWTPDGNKIVFTGLTSSGNYDIYLMDADGSNPVQLTNDPAWDTHARVNQDGTKIAFMSKRTGSSEIWVMDIDGSNQHQITFDPVHENSYPDWSPDGSNIIFTKYDGSTSHLWMINADGNNPIQLTNGDSYNDLADWYTDDIITFRSTRSGNWDIWILEPGEDPDPSVSLIYGDDGIYTVTLTVTDNDNLSATDTCNVTVQNVNPTITIESITMNVEIGLRVAGRKYNNVSMSLYEEGNSIGYVSIEHLPGSPNEQMAWIPISINFSKSYNTTVIYTPKDPPKIGGNPVWIFIKSKNGSINKIHHTFNVQQSKKRDSEHWNHVEPWEISLNSHLIGLPFEITSQIMDPGSDDEILTYTYGSQVKMVTYLNNPPDPDPFPSPEVNPVDIMDTTTLIYKGLGTLIFTVRDDDNVRLGDGQSIDSISIT
jgi:outer membrane protein assembly factor BamB/Tol biopolymer transport system component